MCQRLQREEGNFYTGQECMLLSKGGRIPLTKMEIILEITLPLAML
jgi:hypothetical protein